jgi:hypothetical protein
MDFLMAAQPLFPDMTGWISIRGSPSENTEMHI